MKRFYKDVTVAPRDGGYAVLLDGRAIRTQGGGKPQIVPSEALAQALAQEWADQGETIDPTRFVTVMIPAYNEERVIERAVRGVLASTDVAIEVIVIDDGSKDRTSAVVAEAFGDDPRVRLLTLENGGKARALNTALAQAKGEIVIALDADTGALMWETRLNGDVSGAPVTFEVGGRQYLAVGAGGRIGQTTSYAALTDTTISPGSGVMWVFALP